MNFYLKLRIFTFIFLATFTINTYANEVVSSFLKGNASFEQVAAQAKKEKEVNWYYWGGSEDLNFWIDTVVAPALKKEGIKLNNFRIKDTREAIDLILAEKLAGKKMGQGSVDLLWVNGDNFLTLLKADALMGPFADKLPNSKYFSFDESEAEGKLNLFDFGQPTGKTEMPWSAEQYMCYADTARIKLDEIPKDFPNLESYLKKNPGKFTYVAPPQYNGTTFLETTLRSLAKSPDLFTAYPAWKENEFSGTMISKKEFYEITRPGFEFLKRIEPLLTGGGKSSRGNPVYPADQAILQAMFKNGEINMACEFGMYIVPVKIKTGEFTKTTVPTLFPIQGMIKNKNFMAIPAVAPNPSAAMVLVNLLSSPELQISKLKKIGYPSALDITKLSAKDKKAISLASPKQIIDDENLSSKAVPDFNASLVPLINEIWAQYIKSGTQQSYKEVFDAVLK